MLYAVKNDDGEFAFCEIGEPHWEVGFGTLWSEINKPYAERTAKDIGGHVVELVEKPEQVVVSKTEAEMLEKAKHNPTLRPSFMITEYSNSHKGYILGNDLEDRLMCAYVNGWEAEPEAKWYVQTPKEWWGEPDIPEWMGLDTLSGVCSNFSKLGRTAFTRAELKQYHLDSDIFTLVSAENEEVSR